MAEAICVTGRDLGWLLLDIGSAKACGRKTVHVLQGGGTILSAENWLGDGRHHDRFDCGVVLGACLSVLDCLNWKLHDSAAGKQPWPSGPMKQTAISVVPMAPGSS